MIIIPCSQLLAPCLRQHRHHHGAKRVHRLLCVWRGWVGRDGVWVVCESCVGGVEGAIAHNHTRAKANTRKEAATTRRRRQAHSNASTNTQASARAQATHHALACLGDCHAHGSTTRKNKTETKSTRLQGAGKSTLHTRERVPASASADAERIARKVHSLRCLAWETGTPMAAAGKITLARAPGSSLRGGSSAARSTSACACAGGADWRVAGGSGGWQCVRPHHSA